MSRKLFGSSDFFYAKKKCVKTGSHLCTQTVAIDLLSTLIMLAKKLARFFKMKHELYICAKFVCKLLLRSNLFSESVRMWLKSFDGNPPILSITSY